MIDLYYIPIFPANRSKNKCTFITPSHGLFLTYRGEKYTVLCIGYKILYIWVLKHKTLSWGGGLGCINVDSHPLQSHDASQLPHAVSC
jgi:hypothetical protein